MYTSAYIHLCIIPPSILHLTEVFMERLGSGIKWNEMNCDYEIIVTSLPKKNIFRPLLDLNAKIF